jgi:hypothetical protein
MKKKLLVYSAIILLALATASVWAGNYHVGGDVSYNSNGVKVTKVRVGYQGSHGNVGVRVQRTYPNYRCRDNTTYIYGKNYRDRNRDRYRKRSCDRETIDFPPIHDGYVYGENYRARKYKRPVKIITVERYCNSCRASYSGIHTCKPRYCYKCDVHYRGNNHVCVSYYCSHCKKHYYKDHVCYKHYCNHCQVRYNDHHRCRDRHTYRISVSITGSHFYVDGVYYGLASEPLRLSPGTHEIDIVSKGYKTHTFRTNSKAGNETSMSIKLTK